MSDRTIAPRLRRLGLCLALPFALAGLSAQAADAMTFNPTNATQLFTDVNTANSTPGFNVIQLADVLYLPSSTQFMTITGNLEITGPPQLQQSQFTGGQPPTINAENEIASGKALFTIAPGANVIMKAFNLGDGGGLQWPLMQDAGGTLELDNMALFGSPGDALDISTATSNQVTINDSTVTSDTSITALLNNAPNGSQLVLNNDSITQNGHDGIAGPFISHNTVFAGNNPSCAQPAVSDVNSEDDDFTCGVAFTGSPNLQAPTTAAGGPTFTAVPGPGSDVIGAGSTAWCERSDQRFFSAPSGSTSCDIGAVDTSYTLQSDTAPPVCNVAYIHSGPSFTPNEMQVTAQDSGVAGEGGDAITNSVIELKGTTTTNGTVSEPNVPGTLFDETSPTANILDAPSNIALPVTADKPTGDTTAGDTFWSFTASDWFNNTTTCQ